MLPPNKFLWKYKNSSNSFFSKMNENFIDLTNEKDKEESKNEYKLIFGEEIIPTCLLMINRKIEKINEKLFYFDQSIEILQNKYDTSDPVIIIDQKFRILFGNTKFFQFCKWKFDKDSSEVLYSNFKKLLMSRTPQSHTPETVFSKIEKINTSESSKFSVYFERINELGVLVSVTINVNKIMNSFEKAIYEFHLKIKPLK
jgi:hypothetical protein